jgi:hypothetical protein
MLPFCNALFVDIFESWHFCYNFYWSFLFSFANLTRFVKNVTHSEKNKMFFFHDDQSMRSNSSSQQRSQFAQNITKNAGVTRPRTVMCRYFINFYYLFILVAVNTYLRMHILTGPAVPMVGTSLIAAGAGSASTVTKTNWQGRLRCTVIKIDWKSIMKTICLQIRYCENSEMLKSVNHENAYSKG